MARDRKRAKQRRGRRGTSASGPGAAAAGRGREGAGDVPPSQPTRTELPGALDHASGEVDEFDAALVRGAEGVASTPESLEDGLDASSEDQLQVVEPVPGRGGDGARAAAGLPGRAERERPSGAPLRGGNRALAFLRASWAELQRVQWPDRRGVTQATAVVLGFVVVAGVYLGVADVVAKEFVELIL